jgi:hypothetical protein
MKPRTVLVGILCAAGVIGSGFAINTIADRIAHRSDGPRHVFAHSGTDPISDEDAIRFSKEVLVADGRFSPELILEAVGRGSDPAYVSVSWNDRETGWRWYVQLKHSPGKLECVSYPGK